METFKEFINLLSRPMPYTILTWAVFGLLIWKYRLLSKPVVLWVTGILTAVFLAVGAQDHDVADRVEVVAQLGRGHLGCAQRGATPEAELLGRG